MGGSQAGEGLGLELEPARSQAVAAAAADQLERDVAAEVVVDGLVDDAHRTGAEPSQHAKAIDALWDRSARNDVWGEPADGPQLRGLGVCNVDVILRKRTPLLSRM